MPSQGRLFVFEGADNVGKTSLSQSAAEYLRGTGLDCELFAFPGQAPGTLGKHVYSLHHALIDGIASITPTSLQLLHIAAHIDAIESRILPALQNGRSVVLDRFWWSTLVYGRVGGAKEALLQKMIELERLSWTTRFPAAVFLIQRSSPIGSDATGDWKAASAEYTKLAAQEASSYPVRYVHNDGLFSGALSQVIGHIKLIEVLRNGNGSTTANEGSHPAST